MKAKGGELHESQNARCGRLAREFEAFAPAVSDNAQVRRGSGSDTTVR